MNIKIKHNFSHSISRFRSSEADVSEIIELIHAKSVSADKSYTLCGQDTGGDDDREIIGDTTAKITCNQCITIIWGVHRIYPLDSCCIKAVSKNKRIVSMYSTPSVSE